MKILFLESIGWDGVAFRSAIADLGLPQDFDVQIGSATEMAPSNWEPYDIIFLSIEKIESLILEGIVNPVQLQKYWVALVQDHELEQFNRWLGQVGLAPLDYLIKSQDGSYLTPLALTLRRLFNTAQREKRLQHLEAENQLFKTVINRIPSKIFVKDWEGRYILANQSLAEFYGTTPQAIVGRREADFYLGSAVAETFLQQDRDVIETRDAFIESEEYEVDSQGEEHWLHWHKQPIVLSSQSAVAALGIGTDVTHYHNLLEALGTANQRLSLALRAATAGVWNWNLATNHMTWSDENFRLLGYYPNACEASYANWLAAIHPDDREAIDSTLLQVLADQTDLNIEVRVQWPDGSLHWLQCLGQFTHDERGNSTGIIGIQIDITERKLTEAAIAFQASLLEQVRNAVIATDLNGNITYWNQFAETMYQWSAREAMGANITEMLVPQGESLQVDLILQTLADQGYWEGELEVYRKDGSLLPIHGTDSLIQDEQGTPIGFVRVSSDISDRKHLEAEQTRQRRLLDGQREVLELMALGTPLPEVLNQIVQIMEAQTRGMVGSILLLKDQQLWHGAAPSLPETYQQAINGIEIGSCAGSCGTAAYLKEPIAVTDIATDPLWEDYRDLALAHGFRACWSVPIFSRTGEVLGTFAQYFRQPYLPDFHDWEWVNIAVKLAGLAIEQNQSDTALKASEARFRAIFEQAAVGICQVSLNGQVLRANQRLGEILGYPLEELITHTFQDLTHPDDLATNLEVYQHLLTGKLSTYTLEKRYIRKDGTTIWSNLTTSLLRNEAGMPLCMIKVIEDITPRKQAEMALQQLNQTLENRVADRTAALEAANQQLHQSLAERQMLVALVENSTDFIVTATLTEEMTYLNRGGRQLVGLSETSDISAYTVSDFHFPEDWPELNRTVIATIRAGGTWHGEVRLRHFKTGAAIPMVHSAFTINDPQTGELVAFAGILRDITDLKQAEAALRESETRMRIMIEALPDLLLRVAPDGSCQDVIYSRYASDQFFPISQHLCEVLPEPLLQRQLEAIHQAITTGDIQVYEHQLEHQGNAVYEEVRVGAISADEALVIVRNISDRKQAEAALRESEARYRLLMDQAGDAIMMASTEGQLLDINQKALTLLDYSRQELLSMTIDQIYPPETLEDAKASFARLLEDRAHPPFKNIVLRKDGRRVPVEITATLIEINGQWVAQGIFRDISERQRVEREMFLLRERLQFLLSASPAIIYTCKPDGEFACTFISENIERNLGYTPAEWQASSGFWLHRLHPEDTSAILAGLGALFEQGYHSHEYRFLHKAGHYVWIRDELRLIYDEQGQPLEIVGYIADVTNLKQVELALQQLNENLETIVHQRTQELQKQTNLLETILNSMGDGVLVANQEGEIILYNPAGAAITLTDMPTASDPAIWQSHWGIFLANNAPCPAEQVPLWRAIQGESFDRLEIILRNQHFPQGVYLEVTGRPLSNDVGQPIGGVAVFRDITDRKRSEAELRYNSLHDRLTNLPNRDYLTQQLELAIEQAQPPGHRGFAMLFLDLDHFKVINDSLGHAAGDQVLVQIAQWLESLVGPTDLAARLGGDEFVLLLTPMADRQAPLELANRLLQDFQAPLTVSEREIFLSTSIGVVIGDGTYRTAADVLRDADIALYQAKARGRSQYALFTEEMHVQALERLQLEHDLRNALGNEELRLFYQPVMDLKGHRVVGFEALVRWQHPTQGFISPAKFIPLAEETGLISLLDRWVLRTACQQLVSWHRQFPAYSHLTISTNLVVTDLMYPDILNTIDQILQETGLSGHHLNLEITESMLIEQIQSMALVLEQLQTRGIHVSIDDFGTGYSSLSYLHQLPVNAFKIDRSFVMQMESNLKNAEIVKTIITLSNRLGLKIIAEGIETEAQLTYLQGLDCDMGQGYFFSAPLPTEAATSFLADKALSD